MRGLASVEALAGIGLEGDRYALGIGEFSTQPAVDRDITLIAAEELGRLAVSMGITLAASESRRNVTTRGVALNDLVGRRFRVGDVVLQGTRLCEPCTHLEAVTGKPLMRPLVHRAGLRAMILVGGTISVGDAIAAE